MARLTSYLVAMLLLFSNANFFAAYWRDNSHKVSSRNIVGQMNHILIQQT